jgi:hypothetical protein
MLAHCRWKALTRMFALSVSVLAAPSSFFETRAALQLDILALHDKL